MVIKYGKQLETSVFESITITSAEHRFGLWKIGIGTPRTKIESIYKYIRKIKDLPEDEFGVIDGRTWLWFKFDKDNTVSKIILTTGF